MITIPSKIYSHLPIIAGLTGAIVGGYVAYKKTGDATDKRTGGDNLSYIASPYSLTILFGGAIGAGVFMAVSMIIFKEK